MEVVREKKRKRGGVRKMEWGIKKKDEKREEDN